MAGSSPREAGSSLSGQTRTGGAVSAVPTIVVLLGLGLALRLIIAYVLLPNSGFPNDVQAFQYWGQQIAANGPWGFYDAPGFHDYPPVYLMLLGVVAVVTAPFGGIGDAVKIVPMLSDLALAVVVWKMAEEFGAARWRALLAAAVIVVNPVTWLDSAIWGQADAVGTVFLLLGLRELLKDRRESAAALAVLAALTKPQLGILAILVAVIVIRRSLWPGERGVAQPRRILTSALAGAFAAAAICLPFVGIHFSIGSELSTMVGRVEAIGAAIAAAAVFYVALTSKSRWLSGAEVEAEPRESRTIEPGAPASVERPPAFDLTQFAVAAAFALATFILFIVIRFDVIVGQMVKTFAEYSYLTVNAFNPWALLSTADGTGQVTSPLGWVQDGNWPGLTGPAFMFVFDSAVALPIIVALAGLLIAAVAGIVGVARPARIAAVGFGAAAIVAGIVGVAHGLLPDTISIAPALVGEIGLLLVLVATSMWAAWRDDDAALIVALTILTIAFFVVPTRAHERYLFPFFGVGAILFAVSSRWRKLYAVLAVANLANLLPVLVVYKGIPVPAGQAASGGFSLQAMLNDWGNWLLSWRVDSADKTSWVVPIAAVAITMGLGFLWSLGQMLPSASSALEAERIAASIAEPEFETGAAPADAPTDPRDERARRRAQPDGADA